MKLKVSISASNGKKNDTLRTPRGFILPSPFIAVEIGGKRWEEPSKHITGAEGVGRKQYQFRGLLRELEDVVNPLEVEIKPKNGDPTTAVITWASQNLIRPIPRFFPTAEEIRAKMSGVIEKLKDNPTKLAQVVSRKFQPALRSALLDLNQIAEEHRWMYETSHVVPVADSLRVGAFVETMDLNNAQLFKRGWAHSAFDKYKFSYASNGVAIRGRFTDEEMRVLDVDLSKLNREPLTNEEDYYMARHRAKAGI